MSAQSSYSDTPAIALEGMIAEQFSLRQVDSGLAEGAIAMAACVKFGTLDGQYVPCVADDAVDGVAILQGASLGVDVGYADKEAFPVLSVGRYYAVADGALSVGDEVAQIIATGKVAAESAGTTTLAFAKVFTSVTGVVDTNDLVILELL